MKSQAVVDRIEDKWAVLLVGEQEKEVHFPVELLPDNIKEGDYLSCTWQIDEDATEQAKARVTQLLDKLVNKSLE